MARSRRAQGRSRAAASAGDRLTLDAGAVIALSRGVSRARAYVARALEADAFVVVPAVVLAETLRGHPRDAAVNKSLKSVGEIAAATESVGRVAGHLLGAAGGTATIDALVVADAVCAGGGIILTGDPDDLGVLAAARPEVAIHTL